MKIARSDQWNELVRNSYLLHFPLYVSPHSFTHSHHIPLNFAMKWNDTAVQKYRFVLRYDTNKEGNRYCFKIDSHINFIYFNWKFNFVRKPKFIFSLQMFWHIVKEEIFFSYDSVSWLFIALTYIHTHIIIIIIIVIINHTSIGCFGKSIICIE